LRIQEKGNSHQAWWRWYLPWLSPREMGALTSAKASEFWAFLFEGNKVLAWEICSILRGKDFGESSIDFGGKPTFRP